MVASAARSILFGGKWTPKRLPGLVAWYKADAGVYNDAGNTPAANNDPVQQWNDQSGNGYHLKQPTLATRPIYLSAGLNSKPTIRTGNGAVNGMISAVGVAIGPGLPGSIFMIGTVLTTSSANARLVVYAPPTTADTVAGVMYLGRNSQAIFTAKGTNSNFGTSSAITYGVVTRIGGLVNSTTLNTYVNNVAGTSAATTDAFVSGGYIAFGTNIASAGTLGSTKLDGSASEIIITNTALSPTDLALLDAYLVSRWS